MQPSEDKSRASDGHSPHRPWVRSPDHLCLPLGLHVDRRKGLSSARPWPACPPSRVAGECWRNRYLFSTIAVPSGPPNSVDQRPHRAGRDNRGSESSRDGEDDRQSALHRSQTQRRADCQERCRKPKNDDGGENDGRGQVGGKSRTEDDEESRSRSEPERAMTAE
jgi:hypothetical protein